MSPSHAMCPTTLTLSSISILLNGFIMCNILGRHTHRSLRPSHILIPNLAFITNFGAVLGGVYVCSWDKYFETLWICSLFSYLRNTVTILFSLSVLGVSYERMRSLKSNMVGELLVTRVLCFIWSVSILGGIPSVFATRMVNHTHYDGTVHVLCVKTDPMQFYGLGILYELLRGTICHIIVPAYLIYELYCLRSKLKYFFAKNDMSNARLRKRTARVRFIYINSTIFAMIWIPYGFGTFYYKTVLLQARTLHFLQSGEDPAPEPTSILMSLLATLFHCYILLLPLIIFCTNHQGPNLKIGWFLHKKKDGNNEGRSTPPKGGAAEHAAGVEQSVTNVIGNTTISVTKSNDESSHVRNLDEKIDVVKRSIDDVGVFPGRVEVLL